jgi:C4-dicarboxylate transporter DctM subunit
VACQEPYAFTSSGRSGGSYSLTIGLFVYKDGTFKDLPKIFARSVVTMPMILLIITNAMAFAFILTAEGILTAIAGFIIEHTVTPLLLLFLLIPCYILTEPSAALLPSRG